MSIAAIIQSLEKMIQVHYELLNISKDKTELLKEGTVDKLQKLLVKEQKYIKQLELAEKNRLEEVNRWALEQGVDPKEITISYLIEKLEEGPQKQELDKRSKELVELISNLKQQEALNETLLNQSMEFVQLSLDLLKPTLKNLNYGDNPKKDTNTYNRSFFDSQV